MTMEERSGGAVEKGARNNLVASSRSMCPKMMRMKKRTLVRTRAKIRI